MTRCVLDLGIRGFQIGSHINAHNSRTGVENVMLSDRRYMPIWETAKDLGVGIFVHPWNMEWCVATLAGRYACGVFSCRVFGSARRRD